MEENAFENVVWKITAIFLGLNVLIQMGFIIEHRFQNDMLQLTEARWRRVT